MSYQVIILEPAFEFISSLDNKLKAKTFRTIDLLKEFGHFIKEPHSKSLKGNKGLLELRVKFGSNICRLFYFYHKDKIYVITSGYIKKQNKTSQKEINIANSIMNTFLEENNEKN